MIPPVAHIHGRTYHGMPWPSGTWDVRALEEIGPGVLLAPVEWERRHFYRPEIEPWALVVRPPVRLRVLAPGAATWDRQIRLTCRAGGESFYYTGSAGKYVRILIPRKEWSPDEETRGDP